MRCAFAPAASFVHAGIRACLRIDETDVLRDSARAVKSESAAERKFGPDFKGLVGVAIFQSDLKLRIFLRQAVNHLRSESGFREFPHGLNNWDRGFAGEFDAQTFEKRPGTHRSDCECDVQRRCQRGAEVFQAGFDSGSAFSTQIQKRFV